MRPRPSLTGVTERNLTRHSSDSCRSTSPRDNDGANIGPSHSSDRCRSNPARNDSLRRSGRNPGHSGHAHCNSSQPRRQRSSGLPAMIDVRYATGSQYARQPRPRQVPMNGK